MLHRLLICASFVSILSLASAAQDASLEEIVAVVGEENVETREVHLTPIRVPGIERALTVVEFDAPSVGRRMKYIAILPENYEQDTERRYPVLYLLHGFSQNYTVFPRMGVPQYTEDLDLIVIMPDAGNSWYVNWSQTDNEAQNNWADYITYDLIESVDGVFRTVPTRLGRAISGVSMGGYGAITLALRRPDLFISAASHSGALAYAKNARLRLESGAKPQPSVVPSEAASEDEGEVPEIIGIEGFTYQYERYPEGIAFSSPEQCKAYDPFELIQRVPPQHLPHLYIDCGTEDNLIHDARDFVKYLSENDMPFTFAQSPGAHGVRYWTRELAHSIAVQYSLMKHTLDRVPDPLSLPNTDNNRPVPGPIPSGHPAHSPEHQH